MMSTLADLKEFTDDELLDYVNDLEKDHETLYWQYNTILLELADVKDYAHATTLCNEYLMYALALMDDRQFEKAVEGIRVASKIYKTSIEGKYPTCMLVDDAISEGSGNTFVNNHSNTVN